MRNIRNTGLVALLEREHAEKETLQVHELRFRLLCEIAKTARLKYDHMLVEHCLDDFYRRGVVLPKDVIDAFQAIKRRNPVLYKIFDRYQNTLSRRLWGIGVAAYNIIMRLCRRRKPKATRVKHALAQRVEAARAAHDHSAAQNSARKLLNKKTMVAGKSKVKKKGIKRATRRQGRRKSSGRFTVATQPRPTDISNQLGTKAAKTQSVNKQHRQRTLLTPASVDDSPMMVTSVHQSASSFAAPLSGSTKPKIKSTPKPGSANPLESPKLFQPIDRSKQQKPDTSQRSDASAMSTPSDMSSPASDDSTSQGVRLISPSPSPSPSVSDIRTPESAGPRSTAKIVTKPKARSAPAHLNRSTAGAGVCTARSRSQRSLSAVVNPWFNLNRLRSLQRKYLSRLVVDVLFHVDRLLACDDADDANSVYLMTMRSRLGVFVEQLSCADACVPEPHNIVFSGEFSLQCQQIAHAWNRGLLANAIEYREVLYDEHRPESDFAKLMASSFFVSLKDLLDSGLFGPGCRSLSSEHRQSPVEYLQRIRGHLSHWLPTSTELQNPIFYKALEQMKSYQLYGSDALRLFIQVINKNIRDVNGVKDYDVRVYCDYAVRHNEWIIQRLYRSSNYKGVTYLAALDSTEYCIGSKPVVCGDNYLQLKLQTAEGVGVDLSFSREVSSLDSAPSSLSACELNLGVMSPGQIAIPCETLFKHLSFKEGIASVTPAMLATYKEPTALGRQLSLKEMLLKHLTKFQLIKAGERPIVDIKNNAYMTLIRDTDFVARIKNKLPHLPASPRTKQLSQTLRYLEGKQEESLDDNVVMPTMSRK